MYKIIINLFLLLISPFALAIPAVPVPLFCPEVISCSENYTITSCEVQGQYAASWGKLKTAGSAVIKGVYTFDSAWVKYVNGYPTENECYFINKSSSTRYLSVSNKGRPGFVAVPLNGSWKKAAGKEEIVQCQGASFFECPLLINP